MSHPGFLGQGAAPTQAELMPELSMDKHWFHVTRSMYSRKVVAEMGPVAYTVYCCIKAHTALDSGRAWPSQQRIAEQCGISVDTVARATDKLIEMGHIRKLKEGRRNEYELTEKFPLTNMDTGQVVAQADTTYVPMRFQKEIQAIEAFCRSGSLAKDSRVQITFNVNYIQQGDNSTVTVNQGPTVVTDTTGRVGAEQTRQQQTLLDRLRTIEG